MRVHLLLLLTLLAILPFALLESDQQNKGGTTANRKEGSGGERGDAKESNPLKSDGQGSSQAEESGGRAKRQWWGGYGGYGYGGWGGGWGGWGSGWGRGWGGGWGRPWGGWGGYGYGWGRR